MPRNRIYSYKDAGSGEVKACRQRTTLEKGLIAILVVIFILDNVKTNALPVSGTEKDAGVMIDRPLDFDRHFNVCTSLDCVIAASSLAVKMDMTADPCQDFAQYACGGFYRDTIIPDDNWVVNSFTTLGDKNMIVLRRILEDDVRADDPTYVKNMKKYYHLCMDEDTIEKQGVTSFLQSPESKEWPVLNPSWNDCSFNLNDVIEKYERLFVEPLFRYFISPDIENSTKNMLNIAQPRLGLSLSYMKLPRNNSVLKASQQLFVDYSVALGADKATAEADAEAFLDFERELASISVTPEETIDASTLHNPTTLQNMTRDYPFIDFHRAIQAAFDHIDMQIPLDLPVNNNHPKYFSKLNGILSKTSNRVIQNRFGYLYARNNLGPLTKELRNILLKFKKVRYGENTEGPRWKRCIVSAHDVFREGMGKEFALRMFTEDSKKYIDTMVTNLKSTFEGLLREAKWMGPKTKEEAYLKLKTMRRKIGYPDTDFEVKDMEKRYENYTVVDGKYYETSWKFFIQMNLGGLRRLFEPVNKDKWTIGVAEDGAIYRRPGNEITFPAGILQPPFFSAKYPSSVNYGAIGAVIGHEITHGYDLSGSQYDHLGNLRNWWQKEDLKEFKNRTQCLIDQYSAFKVDEINLHVDGQFTVVENTADVGGLKEAYRAYKAYAETQTDELPLPGLGLSPDQQFFLAFSQLWCAKNTAGNLRSNVLGGDEHSPERFRIKGPLQNNKDFARLFQCPLGSPMNPEKKCEVW